MWFNVFVVILALCDIVFGRFADEVRKWQQKCEIMCLNKSVKILFLITLYVIFVLLFLYFM
jgi:hypothetical protein